MDAPPPDLTVDAAHVEWVDGKAVATGDPVRAWWGDAALEAARLEVEGDVVRITDGEVRRAGAVFRFAAGEWDLASGAATLTTATYAGPTTCSTGVAPLLTAGSLHLDPAGTWTVEDGVVLPCPCVPGAPVVAVSAARAEVVPEHHVVVHGGALRILGLPLVPVPWARIALRPEAFRLLLPEIGYGDPGWSVAWAGTGVVEGWRLTAGPAWRQDRGFRLDADARGEPGTVKVTGGWDAVQGRVRGAVAGRGGVSEGRGRFAWDVAWQSDLDWRDDYGLDYVARGVTWADDRLVLAGGPFTGSAWAADDGSTGELLGLRQDWRARGRAGRWGIDAYTRTGVVGAARVSGVAAGEDDLPLVDDPDVRVGGGATAYASRTWGALHLEGRAEGEGWLYADAGAGGQARALARAEVPVWTALRGGARAQWWPGLLVDSRVRAGAALIGDERLLPEPALVGLDAGASDDTAWLWAGGALRADARLSGVAVTGEVRLGAGPSPSVPAAGTGAGSTDDGIPAPNVVRAAATDVPASTGLAAGFRFDPQLRAAVDGERVGARLYATRDGASGEVRGTVGPAGAPISPWVGAWWGAASDAALAWTGLDGRWRRLVYGATVTLEPTATDAFTGATLRGGYDDGCARLVVSAAVSPDRALPDFGVSLALRR